MRRYLTLPIAILGLALAACSSDDDGTPTEDAGTDAADGGDATLDADTAPDVVPDTAPDVQPDTAPDVDPDALPDTAPDVLPDTAPDTADGGGDTAPDVIDFDTDPSELEGCDTVLYPSGDDDTTAVQEAWILAEEGDTLCFAAGRFHFTSEVSLDVDGVTVRGVGRQRTILDFSEQDLQANGIRITSDNVTFHDLRVVDTPGDGIRADDVANITFRRVDVIWSEAQSLDSGAYGLYPVGSEGVIIDDCLVVGARDAGIYVGQSDNVLVANSEAYGNVAGIEIENTTNAEVRDNWAHDNTAGILVFNLPGLAQYGGAAKVHSNLVENNNIPNFGVDGTIVAVVPPGIGILVLACDDNEFHDNIIRGNDSIGLLLFTYLPGLFGSFSDPNFDTYSERNWVHNNTFENNGGDPSGSLHAVVSFPEPSPDMTLDGCFDADLHDDRTLGNCFSDNGDARFFDFDFCGGGTAQSDDIAPFTCEGTALPPRDFPDVP